MECNPVEAFNKARVKRRKALAFLLYRIKSSSSVTRGRSNLSASSRQASRCPSVPHLLLSCKVRERLVRREGSPHISSAGYELRLHARDKLESFSTSSLQSHMSLPLEGWLAGSSDHSVVHSRCLLDNRLQGRRQEGQDKHVQQPCSSR